MSFLSIQLARQRRSRKRRDVAFGPPSGALTLVSAEYNPGTSIRLTFNQAIDIAAIDVTAITVQDGPFISVVYRGFDTPTMVGANAFDLALEEIGPYSGADVLLTATASNGIVSVADAEQWAGVTDYVVTA